MTPMVLAMILAGCVGFGLGFESKDKDSAPVGTDSGPEVEGDADTDADSDSDADADADSDADADADSDTDSDADTDWEPEVDCSGSYDTSLPGGPDCVTSALRCGDELTATTKGGLRLYDEDFYNEAYCFVPYQDYGGPERVYELEVDAGVSATVSLWSPCKDLSLSLIRWSDDNECPSADTILSECEGKEADDAVSASVWADKDLRFLVAVDGAAGVEVPFALKVECE